MNGYEICECGKFAFIYSANVLKQLPDGYVGELCPECGLWMCAVDKLPPGTQIDFDKKEIDE